ncbi:hypothetical protein Poly21_08150 [Allorhodopirellula heiligendammensis]|uniref:Uncharacterized protein n=2 Tax=Allorhodopirellula heiligendammensis TaxID=2714739 RepID=A0A5C6C535_9BACT|nr:hypothetical protein Poly21_08150 [Allorhodopirellula heiligendammensis]
MVPDRLAYYFNWKLIVGAKTIARLILVRVDCFARVGRGQRSMTLSKHLADFADMAVPGRKTVQSRQGRRCSQPLGLLVAAASVFIFLSPALGQLTDPLDAYPPRWSLDENDCDARVSEQGHASDSGADGGRCETITLLTGHGTKAVLVYPIEPLRPIDALAATISVKGLARGIRIGFRIRFPYLLDPETKRPAALYVYGSSYERIGEFQSLGVSDIERSLKLKRVSLRNEFGAAADVSSPYVDAVVLNAYGGPGNHTLRLDSLRIDAMVPLVDENAVLPGIGAGRSADGNSILESRGHDARRQTLESQFADRPSVGSPFPSNRVTRILQHNGEPLAWVHSLGFDAVWLSKPPTSSILSEAIAARMKIYAPPPSSPDESLAPLLEPVSGWIVGGYEAMDSDHVDAHTDTTTRLRSLPARWQRPLIGSPVEMFRTYSAMLDGVVLDAPPRVRNVSSVSAKSLRQDKITRCSNKPMAIGISGAANHAASLQGNAIAARIGTPDASYFQWHGMWRQVADALGDRPDAILIRSQVPLSSGTPLQQSRAMSLSFVNRFIAAFEPWVSGAEASRTCELIHDAKTGLPLYVAHRLHAGPTTLLVMTSAMGRGDAAMAGDGKTIEIRLPPADEGKLIWRLTDFSAERLSPDTSTAGTKLSIVSPDVVEVIAISDEIAEAGRIASSAKRFARQAALDRWQLASEALRQTEFNWNGAVAARVVSRPSPTDLLQVARTSLENAERLVRSGQPESSLRMSRRADAWGAKSNWMLTNALLAGIHLGETPTDSTMGDLETGFGRHVSSPPLIAGDIETQVAWTPLLKTSVNALATVAPSFVNQTGTQSRWGVNRLAGGNFERGPMLSGDDVLEREGWSLGRRHVRWADVEATQIERGAFAGKGALRMRVTPRGSDPLPGGYEGTCLMIQSPAVRMQESAVVRIDVMVRTLGFSGPHQGLLIYDSVGSQELGILVNDQPQWTPVTLFRQVGPNTALHVMMEVIGGGEAVIDEIQVRTWESVANPAAALRPIDP